MANMGEVGVEGIRNGSSTCFCAGAVAGTEEVTGIVEGMAMPIEGDG